jgi:hypothetical protein
MKKVSARAFGVGTLLALSAVGHSYAETPQVQYVFAPGISNNCNTFFYSNIKERSDCKTSDASRGSLADKIRTGQNDSVSLYGYGKTEDSRNNSISTQASDFLNSWGNAGSSLPRIIVGHSQGNLRARYAMQNLGATNFAGATGTAVKGFISIDGPHAGAPITVNTPAIARSVMADASTAGLLNVAYNLQPVWNFIIRLFNKDGGTNVDFSSPQGAYAAVISGAKVEETAPGLVDMNPGSSFLNSINANSSCYWLYWGWGGGTWRYICSGGAGTLPSSVNVASIRGKNNKLWGGLESANYIDWGKWDIFGLSMPSPTLRTDVNAGMIFVRQYAWGQQGVCNASFRLWRAACDSWSATLRFLDQTDDQDKALATLVGSTEGDGTVPLSSQSVYSANPSLGGNNLGNFDVEDGSHGGANAVVDKVKTMQYITTIQGLMGVPRSTAP